MNILISNDDGIDAPGLRALADGLALLGTVYVVAPKSEQSAQSHALTLHKPLRMSSAGERRWAVSGTPADCIYLAIHQLGIEPDVVLSGINAGANTGNDVHYSGTVAAAREACMAGLPAISVSLDLWRDGPRPPHWDTATAVSARIVQAIADAPLKRFTHLNVNVPNRPLDQIMGLRGCALGPRRYVQSVDIRRDPRGKTYFWIGGRPAEHDPEGRSDGTSLRQGWVSVTPITVNPTDYRSLEDLHGWTDD